MSEVEFDTELQKIDHFNKFPCMLPYIGHNYGNGIPKILVIGKYYYLPKELKPICENANEWYKSTEKGLSARNEDFNNSLKWIHCRDLLTSENWNNGAHIIFKKLNDALGSIDAFKDKRKHIKYPKHVRSIAFINAFQRPGIENVDFKPKEEDICESVSILEQLIDILRPDCTIFVSKGTYNIFYEKLNVGKNTIKWTYYPGYDHWSKPDGKERFVKILKDTLEQY